MKKTLIAVGLGVSLGAVTSFQLAGPVLAQSENDRRKFTSNLIYLALSLIAFARNMSKKLTKAH